MNNFVKVVKTNIKTKYLMKDKQIATHYTHLEDHITQFDITKVNK